MIAYHGKQEVKDKFVKRMKDHIAADELIRGTGFENGRGCAVGCTLNRYDHGAFPEELGVPEWMAHLIDTLHENTSDDVWPTFSLRFLEAIKPGADLEPVRNEINLFILRRNRDRVEGLDIESAIKTQVIAAIDQCAGLHAEELRGVIVESVEWSAARYAASAAWSAASAASAESAARYAAWSAARSAARSAASAESAARYAAWSAASAESAARYAAWSAASAESAARSAASAARSAAWSAASAAWSAARYAEYDAIAEELIRLVKLRGAVPEVG